MPFFYAFSLNFQTTKSAPKIRNPNINNWPYPAGLDGVSSVDSIKSFNEESITIDSELVSTINSTESLVKLDSNEYPLKDIVKTKTVKIKMTAFIV